MDNVTNRLVLDIDDLANNRDISESERIGQLDFIINKSQKLKEEVVSTYIHKLQTLARPNIPVGSNPLRDV